ncbi:DEAD/DEAH box helicase [Cetobacterium sp.]|uniref:DEAD/DEAH box helicase n=2 Tax=Cetobacterium sp. TaxID=2071632 RepID=UPI003F30A623
MSFNLLDPKLREKIITKLEWKSLKPVQEASIPEIIKRKDLIILAPTAGGKTEACFFPILSLMAKERKVGLRCIYLSPIKALLNNQEIRIKELGKFLDFEVFKWHGDVSRGKKEKFTISPKEILMTTPESLEVMLCNSKIDKEEIFKNLEFIIVDEIHSFVENSRGIQLISLLERLSKYTDNPLQRIGLSATVGNPIDILTWLQGSSQRIGVVIKPSKVKKARKVEIKYTEEYEERLKEIYKRIYGKKALVFSNSRKNCERINIDLKKFGVDSYVHHSSIDKNRREAVEELFKYGRNKTIVATSTLELGIDIGGLDIVIQDSSPRTVSSFLQRMGRTGRREGTISWFVFLPKSQEDLLLSVAILSLSVDSWVESLKVNKKSYSIYAHQMIMIVFSHFGILADEIYSTLKKVYAFSEITYEEFIEITSYMLEKKILLADRNKLFIGDELEKDYGGSNFIDLYSTFFTEVEYSIKDSGGLVGTLDFAFARPLIVGSHFILAGECWEVVRKDDKKRVINVEKAKIAEEPRWNSKIGLISYEISRRILKILTERDKYSYLHLKEQNIIDEMRNEYIYEGYSLKKIKIQKIGSKIKIYTFAGNKVNNSLFALISLLDDRITKDTIEWDNLTIKIPLEFDFKELIYYLGNLKENFDELLNQSKNEILSKVEDTDISKFQKYLPEIFIKQEIFNELYDFTNLKKIIELEIISSF